MTGREMISAQTMRYGLAGKGQFLNWIGAKRYEAL
ncbi:hypothetical protein BURKHO8Y_170198 [Burkholderia sp. 8Y]|nr:hypothetical protein BURKHO8Y_170198 [Burkholderia sp. 8Y]